MNVVVKRNTDIPTKISKKGFTTTVDNQIRAPFFVYDGERSMTKDNNLLEAVSLLL